MEKNVYFCPMDNAKKQNTYDLADQEKLGIIHHLQTILLSTHLPANSSLGQDDKVNEFSAKPTEELDKNCRNDGQPWIFPNQFEKTQNTNSSNSNINSKFREKDQGGNLKKLKNNKGKVQTDYLEKKEKDIDKRYMERILWKKNIDGVEPLYRLRTLIFLKHKYQKKEAERMLGPGSYDPQYYHYKSNARKNNQTRGQMKSCTPRLVLDTGGGDCESFPNPNKYFDAWAKLEAANDCRCHPGKVPLFQSTPCMKSRPTQAKLDHLGPALYNIKSPLEEFIKKKTSKRGPYDLYTPPRDIIPYGPRQTIRSPLRFFGFYEIAEIGLGNAFKNSADYQKGRLMTNSRNRRITGERISYESTLWPKNDNLPGPGHYFVNNNQSKRKIDNQKHTAFGVGIGSKARPSTQDDDGALERSPNRYEIARNVHIKGHGHKSAFKSSLAGKRLDLKKLTLLQERLEPTKRDLPPDEINDMNFNFNIC